MPTEMPLAKFFQFYGQVAIRALLLEEENAELRAQLSRLQEGQDDGPDAGPEGQAVP